MNFDQEKRLETEIDRELKALPELLAPGTLILRVMRAIETRLNLPWYRQAWQRWPLGLQTASFLFLLAVFGGLCFGTWRLTQLEGFAAAVRHTSSWFGGFGALSHALIVLVNALLLALKQLGTGFLVASFAALGLAYALCIS